MQFTGIDIGSRSIEIVTLEAGRIVAFHQEVTGYDPLTQIKSAMGLCENDRIMATGYGRHLLERNWNTPTVTEIKAYATGIRHLAPETHTILDIGGQDTKAITLFPDGRIRKFEMNDRCAAGTGRFLEVMAAALGYDLASFGREALASSETIAINSMCTVFAESEVTSLVTAGSPRAAIARGIHMSVIKRAAAMLNRINWKPPLAFAGGVANNPCIVAALEEHLQTSIFVPDSPQYAGALGAALLLAR